MALQRLDVQAAFRLRLEQDTFSKLVDENSRLEDLISKIYEDQVNVFSTRLQRALQDTSSTDSLKKVYADFVKRITQLVSEAKIHNDNRCALNYLIKMYPLDDPVEICQSETRYKEALSFFQYHEFTEGFEADLLNVTID